MKNNKRALSFGLNSLFLTLVVLGIIGAIGSCFIHDTDAAASMKPRTPAPDPTASAPAMA